VVPTLPYLEQGALAARYQGWGATPLYYQVPNITTVVNQRVAVLTCPSDTPHLLVFPFFAGPIALHNYGVNYGSTGFLSAMDLVALRTVGSGSTAVVFNGAPFEPSKTFRFMDITDGLSQTMLAAELVQGQAVTSGKWDPRGHIWWAPYGGFSTLLKPNDSQPDVIYADILCDRAAPNPPCIVGSTTSYPYMQASRSRHQNGVQVVMGDGSARFISNAIPIDTWRALGSSQGGETFAADF
jgi:prepilin-type processing-associated H-X9-DG protein